MNIYVGNLPFSTTEEELESLFAQYGEVTSAKIITDQYTGRPRGFAFVEMDSDGGKEAIKSLDGADFQGRNLKVNEAKPKTDRKPKRW